MPPISGVSTSSNPDYPLGPKGATAIWCRQRLPRPTARRRHLLPRLTVHHHLCALLRIAENHDHLLLAIAVKVGPDRIRCWYRSTRPRTGPFERRGEDVAGSQVLDSIQLSQPSESWLDLGGYGGRCPNCRCPTVTESGDWVSLGYAEGHASCITD